MDAKKDERALKIMKMAAADFLERESNGSSLITVTDARMSADGKYATIFFTVLPDDKAATALQFAKRMRSEFRQYVKEKTKIGIIPLFDFAIDLGEKHRQRIDEISSK